MGRHGCRGGRRVHSHHRVQVRHRPSLSGRLGLGVVVALCTSAVVLTLTSTGEWRIVREVGWDTRQVTPSNPDSANPTAPAGSPASPSALPSPLLGVPAAPGQTAAAPGEGVMGEGGDSAHPGAPGTQIGCEGATDRGGDHGDRASRDRGERGRDSGGDDSGRDSGGNGTGRDSDGNGTGRDSGGNGTGWDSGGKVRGVASGDDNGCHGLLWSDEFDGVAGSAPDLRIWSAATGYGWGRDELQCYTSRPRNLALDGHGNLVITAARERSCEGAAYSSARIETAGKKTMRYGYIEVRASLPTARGSFPAVWMLGANLPRVGWPASGELDLVEVVSAQPRTVHTNIHWAGSNGREGEAGWHGSGTFDAGTNLGAGYHTYGVERTPSRLRFFFDGRVIRTIDRADAPAWPWDGEFYLLLNLAIDGQGARVSGSAYPQRMTVDYVRVYDAKPGGGRGGR